MLLVPVAEVDADTLLPVEDPEADAEADSEDRDADTNDATDESDAEIDDCAEAIEDSSDEGGVVIGTGMMTEPDVEALNEVTPEAPARAVPSDMDGEVLDAIVEALGSVTVAETSLDRLALDDVTLGPTDNV